MIDIHFFANLRERIGCSNLHYEYAGEQTVDELMQHLVQRGENWKPLEEQNVLIAINQTICGINTRVYDGDEIAFFPPVTGG